MALISATELALKTLVEDGDPSAFEPAACPLTALVVGGLAMAAAERACLRARRDEANGEVFLGGKAVRGGPDAGDGRTLDSRHEEERDAGIHGRQDAQLRPFASAIRREAAIPRRHLTPQAPVPIRQSGRHD